MPIEFRPKESGGGAWTPCPSPTWNFSEFEYRVTPVELALWVNIYPQPAGNMQPQLSPYFAAKEAERNFNQDRRPLGRMAVKFVEEKKQSRCPTCNSPEPRLHPAVQCGGEVQVCPHPFHSEDQAGSEVKLDPYTFDID